MRDQHCDALDVSLTDNDLHEEVVLLAELISAANDCDGPLARAEVDAVLFS